MNAIHDLHQLGQSIWYDNIQRSLLESGKLREMIQAGEIRGVTSNPSIFQNAIARSSDYDPAIVPMAWSGWSAEEIFNRLALEDIQAATDLFRPLYDQTGALDGYVSLEVNPRLAQNTQATLAEARRIWAEVGRPNLMVKIPATLEGLPAISSAIEEGINVNVTLIFSLERYREVMEAYLTGLERRARAGLPLDSVASVASFFVSRVDTKVDARLQSLIQGGGSKAAPARNLLGKAAIANARLAYAMFHEMFGGERFARLRDLGARVQRPLWASTSTKNPDYRDVIYVEELIGADTVNTMPPQTLVAFKDHGKAVETLTAGVAEAREAMAALEDLGISIDQVTGELEVEGVKAFADAFTGLLGAIETRRSAALAQLGGLAPAVAARVGAMQAEHFAKRLHAHDPLLWTQDEKAGAEIRQRMNWLESPFQSAELISKAGKFASQVRQEGFTHVLLLGMGGSSLAPEVMRQICGIGEGGLDLIILDSTDPGQVKAAANWSDPRRTVYIVSSKSGSTAEVNAFFDYFWEYVNLATGGKAKDHFIAITDPATSLEAAARKAEFKDVFNADPLVGGRNSALTAFGLVPAALLGLDVDEFIGRAQWMAAQCGVTVPAARNPGLVLGAVIGEAWRQGRDKLTFLADSTWQPLGAWLEQLVAESSGKLGRGILPIDQEPVMDLDRYGADRLFVYLKGDGAMGERAQALRALGQPVLEIAARDALDLAAEFYRWEVAVATACSIVQVNSFDQPDVQDNKTRTVNNTAFYKQNGHFEEGDPFWQADGVRCFGPAPANAAGAQTPAEVLAAFLADARPGEFVAINAYLPRNPENTQKLQTLRAKVMEMTGCASTLGFGPRFLHSTGQYHKGGPNSGWFIQITADPIEDLEIPGEEISFGTLERAQALGDLEALLARGKRAIRVHLGTKPLDALM